jgi:hypothetical protein
VPAAHLAIGGSAIVTAVLALSLVVSRSETHVATAAFWFDDGVTFETPALTPALGGPLDAGEQRTIRRFAFEEVRAAYADYRLDVVDAPTAHYRVRVVQQLPRRWGAFSPAAESRVFGFLGGSGAIAFRTVATFAVDLRPAGATRAAIVAGIGRGLGRIAAHELAHQILPRAALDASDDVSSYDYGDANHSAQFYGPMRWDRARAALESTLGVRSRISSTSR